MEERIKKLEEEISIIKERNKKVEADKAWEISFARTLVIMLITYVFTVITFKFVQIENFWLSSLVPVLGYYLSTWSLPFIKKGWAKYFFY